MPIKRAKRILIIWGLLAALLVAGIAYWASTPAVPDPIYKGKRLSYWFQQLPGIATFVGTNAGAGGMAVSWGSVSNGLTGSAKIIRSTSASVPTVVLDSNWPFANFTPASECLADTTKAIQAMGTNAVPYLMMKLKTKDSLLTQQFQKWTRKLGFKSPLLEGAIVQRGRAATGLLSVPLSMEIRQELGSLSTNADPNIASLAYVILRHNNPPETAKAK